MNDLKTLTQLSALLSSDPHYFITLWQFEASVKTKSIVVVEDGDHSALYPMYGSSSEDVDMGRWVRYAQEQHDDERDRHARGEHPGGPDGRGIRVDLGERNQKRDLDDGVDQDRDHRADVLVRPAVYALHDQLEEERH